jgi:hypothetical protein
MVVNNRITITWNRSGCYKYSPEPTIAASCQNAQMAKVDIAIRNIKAMQISLNNAR